MAIISLLIMLSFWLLIACTVGVALAFGRKAERGFALLLLAACVASAAVGLSTAQPVWTTRIAFASDWIILAVAWALALRSDRFWPLWFAAFQSLTVIMQALAWGELGVRHAFLANLSSLWALPAMIAMTWGTLLDWRLLRATGAASPPGHAARPAEKRSSSRAI